MYSTPVRTVCGHFRSPRMSAAANRLPSVESSHPGTTTGRFFSAAASIQDEKLAGLIRPKSAEQVAKAITACLLKKTPELIYGDAPGFLFRLLKFAPKTTDWITHQVVKRFHPLARGR